MRIYVKEEDCEKRYDLTAMLFQQNFSSKAFNVNAV